MSRAFTLTLALTLLTLTLTQTTHGATPPVLDPVFSAPTKTCTQLTTSPTDCDLLTPFPGSIYTSGETTSLLVQTTLTITSFNLTEGNATSLLVILASPFDEVLTVTAATDSVDASALAGASPGAPVVAKGTYFLDLSVYRPGSWVAYALLQGGERVEADVQASLEIVVGKEVGGCGGGKDCQACLSPDTASSCRFCPASSSRGSAGCWPLAFSHDCTAEPASCPPPSPPSPPPPPPAQPLVDLVKAAKGHCSTEFRNNGISACTTRVSLPEAPLANASATGTPLLVQAVVSNVTLLAQTGTGLTGFAIQVDAPLSENSFTTVSALEFAAGEIEEGAVFRVDAPVDYAAAKLGKYDAVFAATHNSETYTVEVDALVELFVGVAPSECTSKVGCQACAATPGCTFCGSSDALGETPRCFPDSAFAYALGGRPNVCVQTDSMCSSITSGSGAATGSNGPSDSGLGPDMVALIVVGGAAFLVVAGVLLFFIVYRNRRTSTPESTPLVR